MLDSKDPYIKWAAERIINVITPHMQYAATAIHDEIIYDSADDGPEVEIITSIRINHPRLGIKSGFEEKYYSE